MKLKGVLGRQDPIVLGSIWKNRSIFRLKTTPQIGPEFRKHRVNFV